MTLTLDGDHEGHRVIWRWNKFTAAGAIASVGQGKVEVFAWVKLDVWPAGLHQDPNHPGCVCAFGGQITPEGHRGVKGGGYVV